MQIECWQKRPTRIKAVELTEDNAQEVADWVGGEVSTTVAVETSFLRHTRRLSSPPCSSCADG